MTNTDDAESGRLEMTYEELSELENHKIDLNRCTRDELLQLPFLSAQQVMDFIEYRDRHGRIETMVELYMIRSMEKSTIDLLSHFATIYPEVVKDTLPSLKDLIKYGRHELLGTLKVPFYNRRGDENGYLGYKYKHWMHYTFTSGQHVKLGLVASQDAGEPFFAGQNRMGYDFYSFYLMLQKWGCVKRMVAGRYRLKFGLGLVMNNSFGLGKINTLATMGRSINNITPHGSRSEANYLQGIAATFKLSDVLSVTPFVSWRTIDATLNRNSSTVATLLRTGYHRTKSEMERRRNTSQSLFGTNITFFNNGWHVGITGFYTTFNRELQPTTTQLYRHWYPRGSQFWNASIDYGYLNGRLNISGETATGNCKHIATINTLSYQLTPILTLIALQRYYPYQYYSLFSQTFAEGGAAQNESGIYIGGNLTIGRWTQ
ncbi:MAG: helix-hairpin-helix domain-containing protein, partial [Prevotellaceae bacterium]|nr:helix-hairpin-helix domain-containing protein [Prevotellaceae bacterium]